MRQVHSNKGIVALPQAAYRAVILLTGVIIVEGLWNLVMDNWGLVVIVVLSILALILTGKRRAWFEWFNETAFLAWDAAEKKGLLEGLKGIDKYRHYIEVYRAEYIKKFGTPPTPGTIEQARLKAAELSAKEKAIKLPDPTQ